MFLVEHLEPSTGRITVSSGLTRYRFIIWLYGPFSREIYDDLDMLVDSGEIVEQVLGSDTQPRVEEIPLSLYDDDSHPKTMFVYRPPKLIWRIKLRKLARELPYELTRKVDYAVERFGHMRPTELEDYVDKLLHLTPEKKLCYWEKAVDEYLKAEDLV